MNLPSFPNSRTLSTRQTGEQTRKPIAFAAGAVMALLLAACLAQTRPEPTMTAASKATPSAATTPKSTYAPSKTSSTSPTAASLTCAQGWTQLRIGALAKVAGADNAPPNRVRSEPFKGNNTIAQIYPGTIVKIVEGPICADGLVFWQIESSGIPGGIGWTAEGDGKEYWLEPYTYLPESVRLSAYGVNFTVPGSWSAIPNADIVRSGSNDWCVWPEHIKITLTTYPAQSEWKPIIYVYVTEQQPDWYPICPGAPLMKMRRQMLAHGERVIIGSKNTQLFNSELIYVYEGKTSDGKYTIFAFLPVNFPLLAYSSKNPYLPPGGIPFNPESQDLEAYSREVGKQLESASDADFTPPLGLLDALAESITVTSP